MRGLFFRFRAWGAVESRQALSLARVGVYTPEGLTGRCNRRIGPGEGFPAVRPSHTVKLMDRTPPNRVVFLHAGGVLGAVRPMPPQLAAVIPAVRLEAPDVVLDAPVAR